MIVPFWSWDLSNTTHVSSHKKIQLIWAINTVFTSPPLSQMLSWDPLSIRVNYFNSFWLAISLHWQ